MQRGLLVALSGIAFLGGVAVLVFTFGFGIGGIPGLTKVSSVALLLAGLYELAAYLVYRKNAGNRSNEEDIQ
jgi:TctA family transporter